MNFSKWNESKIATLLYLFDDNYILECTSLGNSHGNLTFSAYAPWGCRKKVINYLRKQGVIRVSHCLADDSEYIKYEISNFGRFAIEQGQDL